MPHLQCQRQDLSATSCATCSSLQIPCLLSRDGDRRKYATTFGIEFPSCFLTFISRAGSREQVTALQDRVQFLESLISQGHHRPSQHDDDIGGSGPDPLRSESTAVTSILKSTQTEHTTFRYAYCNALNLLVIHCSLSLSTFSFRSSTNFKRLNEKLRLL